MIETSGLMNQLVRFEDIVEVRPTLQEIKVFIDAGIDRVLAKAQQDADKKGIDRQNVEFSDADVWEAASITVKNLTTESLLKVGDEIDVVEGQFRGMSGVVLRPEEKGKIGVRASTKGEDGSKAVDIDLRTSEVRPKFKVGDSVTVKLGVNAGRSGMVEHTDELYVYIREIDVNKEVREQAGLKSNEVTNNKIDESFFVFRREIELKPRKCIVGCEQ